MKILENSTGGSSIGNNKEVQTARAKNVYRQTQNFDHRHNKGRTAKAQKRKSNKGTTKVEQSRKQNFLAATDNVRLTKLDLFSCKRRDDVLADIFTSLSESTRHNSLTFESFMKAKEEGLAVGESYLFSQKPKKIFPLLFVSYDLYIKGNAGPFSVRGFLLSQSICSLTH